MKRFFISCTCVMMLCTGAMAANWESNHETLSGNYLFSLKNPAAVSGSMWDYATLDTLSTFIKSELTGHDVTFGTIYFTDLISLAADGTHGLEALNTVAITRDPNNLALAPLTDRWWVANGTDWTSNWLLMWSDVGVTIPSYNDIATSGLTFVTTDPTAASDNGQYINTTDAGRWSKNDDYLCEDGVACTAIYTVTITAPENGDLSSVTLGLDTATGTNSVDVLTGTGPVTDWVFTPDSGYECDSVTGFDSGYCTGASITINSDATVGVTFTSTATAKFLEDSFTEASSVGLAAHTPETGGAWSIVDPGQVVVVDTTGLVNTYSDGTLFYNNVSPPNADYSVSAEVFVNNTLVDRIVGPCLRVTSGGNGYCGYLKGTGVFALSKNTDNNPYGEVLVSSTPSVSPSDTHYIIEIEASGTTLTATLKNTSNEVIDSLTINDSTYQSAGFAGGVVRRNYSYIYSIEASN